MKQFVQAHKVMHTNAPIDPTGSINTKFAMNTNILEPKLEQLSNQKVSGVLCKQGSTNENKGIIIKYKTEIKKSNLLTIRQTKYPLFFASIGCIQKI